MVAIVIVDLVRVVGNATKEREDLRKLSFHSVLSRLVDALPFTAIRILVVVWQIISQVRLCSLRHSTITML